MNFYTTYNEKNLARKKEYEKFFQKKEVNKEILKEDNNFSKYDTYINVNGRCFCVGKRDKYKGITRYLEGEAKSELLEVLEKASIGCSKPDGRLLDESWGENDPACYRPILSIGEKRYNIANYNYRTLTESTAKEIKKFFNRAGFGVMIEILGKRVNDNIESVNKLKVTEKPKTITKSPKIVTKLQEELTKQLTFEDVGLYD